MVPTQEHHMWENGRLGLEVSMVLKDLQVSWAPGIDARWVVISSGPSNSSPCPV